MENHKYVTFHNSWLRTCHPWSGLLFWICYLQIVYVDTHHSSDKAHSFVLHDLSHLNFCHHQMPSFPNTSWEFLVHFFSQVIIKWDHFSSNWPCSWNWSFQKKNSLLCYLVSISLMVIHSVICLLVCFCPLSSFDREAYQGYIKSQMKLQF